MVKVAIQKFFRLFGYEVVKVSEPGRKLELEDFPCIDLLDLVVQRYVHLQPEVFFVQVGAHDGVSADPISRQIRKYPNWRGILVEPQPESFAQLVANYGNEERFIFEQMAIAEQDGFTPFYTVTDEVAALSFWLPQSASCDRQNLLNSLYYMKYVRKVEAIPEDFDRAIKTLQVPTMTLKSLLGKHKIDRVDVLALATPGFDFDLIKTFPFEKVMPAIISFEYLTLSDENRAACLRFLMNQGYSVGRFASRAVAVLDVPTIKWTIGEY
jgi:FkbM family methyltransferase